ncbi:MAG: hypothetical protein AAGH89_17260, partial [Verrucomicrobiota bacterium]
MKAGKPPAQQPSNLGDSLSSRFKNERARIDEPEPDHEVEDPHQLEDSQLDHDRKTVVENVPQNPERIATPSKENGHTNGNSKATPQSQKTVPRQQQPAAQANVRKPSEDGPPVNPIAQQAIQAAQPTASQAPAQPKPRLRAAVSAPVATSEPPQPDAWESPSESPEPLMLS